MVTVEEGKFFNIDAAIGYGTYDELRTPVIAHRSGHGLCRRGGRRDFQNHRRRPTWKEFSACVAPREISGSRARAAWRFTPSLLDPKNANRIYVAISAGGAFRADDGGKTWKPINRGLKSQIRITRSGRGGRALRSPYRSAPVAAGCVVHAEALGRFAHGQRL